MRQHEAESVEPRRERLRQRAGSGLQQDDGRLGRDEQGLLGGRDLRVAADHVQVARHQRERLVRTTLASPQLGEHVGAGRVAGEVDAADALDRDDEAVHQRASGRVHVVHHRERLEVDRPATELL